MWPRSRALLVSGLSFLRGTQAPRPRLFPELQWFLPDFCQNYVPFLNVNIFLSVSFFFIAFF